MKCVLLIRIFVLLQITVPPIRTYYHCKVMKFQNLLTKHHIYQVIILSFCYNYSITLAKKTSNYYHVAHVVAQQVGII